MALLVLVLVFGAACEPASPPARGEAPQSSSPRKEWLTPEEGFRLDEKVAEGRVWGSPAIQTPTPLCSGARCVHFADADRAWATHIPIPTVSGEPLALSPDETFLASTGPKEEISVSRPVPPLLSVLRLTDRQVIYSREVPQRGVSQLSWLPDGMLLICENLSRMKPGPSEFVLRRLNLGSKKEETILEFRRGIGVQRVVPDPKGRKVLVTERESQEGPSLLVVYELKTGERRALPNPHGTLDPESLGWWPDFESVYAEYGGHPFRIPTTEAGRADPVLSAFKGFEGKVLQGALSSTGRFLLASEVETQTLFLLDLNEGKVMKVGTCGPRRGPLLRYVTWSKKDDVAAGWIGVSEADRETKRTVLTWIPFLINVPEKKYSLFRFSSSPEPLFVLERPDVMNALRKDSSAWR
jgi:hypothetical protein